jgi:4-hydroxybenzoate polyprenyltransferase
MVYQTRDYLHLNFDFFHYAGFCFCSTVCSYNFHWWLTPYSVSESIRVKWTHDHRLLHLALIVLGALGSLYFLIFFIEDWHWIAIAALLTFLYSAPKVPMPAFAWLRKIAIGKTIFLSFVWTYVTSVLPIALSHSAFGNREVLFCLSRFFLIYPICILFDYRDRENDKQEGIRSMITYLGEGGISRLFYFSLLVFLLSTMALYREGFSALQVVNLLLPGIVVACIYPYSRRNFSDYHFYFLLDGLMMFSALLTLVFRI